MTDRAEATALVEISPAQGGELPPAPSENLTAIAMRVRGEYQEMPGLRLTVPQAARLFGIASDVAHSVLDELRDAAVLTRSDQGAYSRGR